jgi:hypothetical protein
VAAKVKMAAIRKIRQSVITVFLFLSQTLDDSFNVIALPQTNNECNQTNEPSGTANQICQPCNLVVMFLYGRQLLRGRQIRELFGKFPCSGARFIEAEIKNHFIRFASDPVEQTQPWRYGIDLLLDFVEQLSEKRIDFAKIPFQRRQLLTWTDLSGGGAEVEIDVCVDAQKQMLQDQKPPARGRLKGNLPRFAHRLTQAKTLHRLNVAIGKNDIEPLHARAVIKTAGGNIVFHLDGHLPIERRKETETAILAAGSRHDLVELRDDFVYRVSGHASPDQPIISPDALLENKAFAGKLQAFRNGIREFALEETSRANFIKKKFSKIEPLFLLFAKTSYFNLRFSNDQVH